MKLMKRSFCVLLALSLLLAFLPGTVLAARRVAGDANGDGTANYEDALFILRMSIGLEPEDMSLLATCDTNGDGKLTYADALTILRASIGLEELEPAEPPVVEFEGDFTYKDAVKALSDNWNPHTYSESYQSYPLDYITSGLYSFIFNDELNPNEGQEPFEGYVVVPEMAAALPVDITAEVRDSKPQFGIPTDATEGYAYKIALNPAARWDNGTPITASDYVESMKRLLDPKLQNSRAVDYYQHGFNIAGAMEYANQGLFTLIDNGETKSYTMDDLSKGENGQYQTPKDEKVFIAVAYAINHLAGSTLKDYVESFGSSYFGMEKWPDLLSLADGQGKVPLTDETLAMLSHVVTSNPAWGETEDYLPNYLVYGKLYPRSDYSTVGLYNSGLYEITLVLTQPLTGYDLLSRLTHNWLVNTNKYDACLTEKDGSWISTYNTSVETTASYGPYKLTSCQANQSMHFVKNENWYGYTDGKHMYVDPEDGKTYPMYQTTEIDCQVTTESEMDMLMFLSGELMQYTPKPSEFGSFTNPQYHYHNPETGNFFLALNGHTKAIAERENNVNFDKASTDLEVLTVPAFRKALNLSFDRSLLVSSVFPSMVKALGLLGNGYICDTKTGTPYRSTDQAKQVLCDVYGVDPSKHANLDEAVASITGHSIMDATVLFRQAFAEAKELGYITDADKDGICDQTVELIFGVSFYSDTNTMLEEYINKAIGDAAAGSPFAGKIRVVMSDGLGLNCSELLRKGQVDLIMVGWSGMQMDPFGMIQAYTDPNYQFDGAWFDASAVELTLNLGGKDITLSLRDWYLALNGTEVIKDGIAYNFGEGIADLQNRLTILAGIEKAILLNTNYIPMAEDATTFVLSQKGYYVTKEGHPILGHGGLAYLRYRYDDTQWERCKDGLEY